MNREERLRRMGQEGIRAARGLIGIARAEREEAINDISRLLTALSSQLYGDGMLLYKGTEVPAEDVGADIARRYEFGWPTTH